MQNFTLKLTKSSSIHGSAKSIISQSTVDDLKVDDDELYDDELQTEEYGTRLSMVSEF